MSGATDRFADLVALSLRRRRYLSEAEARGLLIEAVGSGLPLDEAQAILAAGLAERRARREDAIDRIVLQDLTAAAGARGWISRRRFDRAARLYRDLSHGAIGTAELCSRVKHVMLAQRWTVRGETVFGTPHWFRAIPAALGRTNS